MHLLSINIPGESPEGRRGQRPLSEPIKGESVSGGIGGPEIRLYLGSYGGEKGGGR